METVLSRTIEVDRSGLLQFAQDLIKIPSPSGHEEEVIRFTARHMEALGFDRVRIDSMGNVLGEIGSGPPRILFDSHLDTVSVDDEGSWDHPPFAGTIDQGLLYGRGAVDMKSAAAASIYAAAALKQSGRIRSGSILVSCTVLEEDCDGVNLQHLFDEYSLRPDYVVICEPSNNCIARGHKGKAQISITTEGRSAHGSAPEKGKNAVYAMAAVIQRIEKTHETLLQDDVPGKSLSLTQITSRSVSLNAVPSQCQVYLDRRLVPGETYQTLAAEMDAILAGTAASWTIADLTRRSWTGQEVSYHPFHLAWQIALDDPLLLAAQAAYGRLFGGEAALDFWDFSTNAVTPVALNIPTIGFGPGNYKLAHCSNEACDIDQIIAASAFYGALGLELLNRAR